MPKSIKRFKDKDKARVYRNKQRRKNYITSRPVERVRRFWTPEENERVLYIPRRSDRELAVELNRSMQAIQVQRCRLLKEIK